MYFTSLAIVSMPVFSSGCSFFLLTDDDAYQRHLKTDHFLKYKQGTLKMVKSLKLNTMHTLDGPTMNLIFKKMR